MFFFLAFDYQITDPDIHFSLEEAGRTDLKHLYNSIFKGETQHIKRFKNIT